MKSNIQLIVTTTIKPTKDPTGKISTEKSLRKNNRYINTKITGTGLMRIPSNGPGTARNKAQVGTNNIMEVYIA